MNYLIFENFLTEQNRNIEVRMYFENGWYVIDLIKDNRFIGKMMVPDPDQSDKPTHPGDTRNKISAAIPHMKAITKLFEEKP